MAASFTLKRGGLLQLLLQVQQDDGTPVDITGSDLFAEIRDGFGALVATPTLQVTDAAAGELTYSALSDATWPVGQLRTDIYLNVGAVPFYTETFFLGVSDPVTQVADRAA